MLSQKQLQDICLMFVGDHRQCRYLKEDPLAWQWYCTKHKKSVKDQTDASVNQFLQDCKMQGIDPQKQGVALGDNCSGYPIFKNIEQGYDKSP
jgi:hypothetical protein